MYSSEVELQCHELSLVLRKTAMIVRQVKCVHSEFNQSGNSLITSACFLEINL